MSCYFCWHRHVWARALGPVISLYDYVSSHLFLIKFGTYRIVDVLERVLVVSFNAAFAHATLGIVLALLANTTRSTIRRFVDIRVKVTLGGMSVALAS